ncbi:hypothetical protein Nepgr_018386 [Nepenthes gracilis]|uniref:Uncharacterized protein n=1 Tax=Nepenthes gracilis TaxID=150966 RepID=A0AAD3XU83_NEPGR|nr:hypothetical protein Nepgr_018386 [Nepenthes gracilis]
MGGFCSAEVRRESSEDLELKAKKLKTPRTVRNLGKRKEEDSDYRKSSQKFDSGELRFSFSREISSSTPRNSGDAKKSSFLGRAGTAGLERAVGALDALGSGMTNLNSCAFTSGMTAKGNKISVLAFEVANTITNATNLVQSISEENVRSVKEEVLHSESVQQFVSTDIKVLLSIAASDKREELRMLSREVTRFGKMCRDPQWHNLDQFFAKLDNENVGQKPLREVAELKTRELTNLVYYTSELYHELNALDRFEHDYHRRLDEVKSSNLPYKGEDVMKLQTEIKHQKKLVWSLKKKSLWSKKMEEVIEKLADIVVFIHHEISEAFGPTGVTEAGKESDEYCSSLGIAGLALHYANVINQIHSIASRPTYLPPIVRDSLYHGLPNSVKTALRSSLRQLDDTEEELTIQEIKDEMETILQWLVPVAANTTKMHQGFGWVGEWANSSDQFSKITTAMPGALIRLQTLYHADKEKTDACILELVIWLHRLISSTKRNKSRFKAPPPRSLRHGGTVLYSAMKRQPQFLGGSRKAKLSVEDRNLLERVRKRRSVPGISRSQDSVRTHLREPQTLASSRSTGRSLCRGMSGARDYLDTIDGLGSPLQEPRL